MKYEGVFGSAPVQPPRKNTYMLKNACWFIQGVNSFTPWFIIIIIILLKASTIQVNQMNFFLTSRKKFIVLEYSVFVLHAVVLLL